jgi:hypothetical protein
MRTLIVVLIAGIVAVGCASAPTDKGAFDERFTAMQIQSGAKFPTAPIYKSTRKIAQADE